MTTQAIITVSVNTSGTDFAGNAVAGAPLFSYSSTSGDAPNRVDDIAIINGNTVVTPPAGAKWLWLVPLPASTVVKKWGGSSGGLIASAAPSLFAISASMTSITINGSGTETVRGYWA